MQINQKFFRLLRNGPSLYLALDGRSLSNQLHTPANLPPSPTKKSSQLLLDTAVLGPLIQSGRDEEHKNVSNLLRIEPQFLGHSAL